MARQGDRGKMGVPGPPGEPGPMVRSKSGPQQLVPEHSMLHSYRKCDMAGDKVQGSLVKSVTPASQCQRLVEVESHSGAESLFISPTSNQEINN